MPGVHLFLALGVGPWYGIRGWLALAGWPWWFVAVNPPSVRHSDTASCAVFSYRERAGVAVMRACSIQ